MPLKVKAVQLSSSLLLVTPAMAPIRGKCSRLSQRHEILLEKLVMVGLSCPFEELAAAQAQKLSPTAQQFRQRVVYIPAQDLEAADPIFSSQSRRH